MHFIFDQLYEIIMLNWKIAKKIYKDFFRQYHRSRSTNMLGKKYMTKVYILGRWYNIAGQPFRGLESAKWNIRKPHDLIFSRMSNQRNKHGTQFRPMYCCIIIEQIVAHYYYTLLHCNDPSTFTMLLQCHIRNDFLHCWWPELMFCSTNWLQSCDWSWCYYIWRIIGGIFRWVIIAHG